MKKRDYRTPIIIVLALAVIGLTTYVFVDKAAESVQMASTQMISPNVGGWYIATQYEDEQIIKTPLVDGEGDYCPIQVEPGKPVKWVIVAEEGEITGCNGEILINEYGIDINIVPGENLIEFTPGDKEDTVEYTCGMDMMRSEIVICELWTDYGASE